MLARLLLISSLQLLPNPIVVILLLRSSVANNGGVMNPSVLVDISITIITRITITYFDLTIVGTPELEEVLDVEVHPED